MVRCYNKVFVLFVCKTFSIAVIMCTNDCINYVSLPIEEFDQLEDVHINLLISVLAIFIIHILSMFSSVALISIFANYLVGMYQ